MSETREADGRRLWWRERLKARRIRSFAAALVGGQSHQAYLRKLGFGGPISLGYDVIDNQFFQAQAQRYRREASAQGLTLRPYLLASNRFVGRKNLGSLLDAFAQVAASIDSSQPFDLCLLGDGQQRAMLEQRCRHRGLPCLKAAPWDPQAISEPSDSCRVLFPGFRQIDELSRFYAHAVAFVHPALSEPWGLVINEAMAAALPILCSSNVGAAEELLEEGVNGFLFNPADTHSIAACLRRFLALSDQEQLAMGQASSRLLAERCPTSAFGEGLHLLLSDLRPLPQRFPRPASWRAFAHP
ncbi:glycosyltransferase [Cyanobium sp. BSA11S]|nr:MULTISPECIES: glycosyltransferase [unclassified Synechococcus]